MIILFPEDYDVSTFSDYRSGIGMITPLTHTVTKELSGIHEGQFTINVNEPIFKHIKVGCILHVNSYTVTSGREGYETFRIYYVSKPINFIATVRYMHVILTELSKIPLNIFTNYTKTDVKNLIESKSPFNVSVNDLSTTQTISNDRPRSVMEFIGGREGSFLDTFGCSFTTTRTTLSFFKNVTAPPILTIEYGKNMSEFTYEENGEDVYTSCYGYAFVNNTLYRGNRYDVVDVSQLPYPTVKLVDFSDKYQDGTTPTTASLTENARVYATENNINTPKFTITCDLTYDENMYGLRPYERLESIWVGAYVTVYFKDYDFSAIAQVNKTEYDPETRRYTKIEIGNYKPTLYSEILKMMKRRMR